MSAFAWATAALVAVAVSLGLGPTVRLPTPTRSPRGERGIDLRRVLLSLLAAAGSAVLVPGPVGAVVAAASAGIAWRLLGRLPSAREVRRRERLAAELPAAVGLLACALRSGADPARGVSVVAEALPGPVAEELREVLSRLALGTDLGDVWSDLGAHPQLGPLGRALARAHRSGASVAVAADRLAEELRDVRRSQVEARARSVSTKAAAPLGLCFLPAFVLLGIVPLVAGLVRSL